MKLQKGITGFWNVIDEEIPSTSDVNVFKNALYPLSYKNALKIIDLVHEKPKSYNQLTLLDISKSQQVNILIHTTFPLLLWD